MNDLVRIGDFLVEVSFYFEGCVILDTVTVVILTYNEEKLIEKAIQSALQCTSHVLVVDSGSTDQTTTVAEELGATVVYRKWDDDFSAQRNFALQYVTTQWVLYLDADEFINQELAEDIRRVTSQKQPFYSYEIVRRAFAFGKRFKHGAMRPDRVQRLFPRNAVTWVNKVHEHPETNLAVKTLKGYADHYTYATWEQYWNKFNHYTSIWAEDAYKRGKKGSYLSAFGHATYGFIKITFLDKGILDGWLGLVMCCNHFMYTLMKYVKLLDLNKR